MSATNQAEAADQPPVFIRAALRIDRPGFQNIGQFEPWRHGSCRNAAELLRPAAGSLSIVVYTQFSQTTSKEILLAKRLKPRACLMRLAEGVEIQAKIVCHASRRRCASKAILDAMLSHPE
jgi:hypothetical protein